MTDPSQSPPSAADPIEIRTEQLRREFDRKVVLNGIDLTIRAGEIVCIVGGSGSGKTVLLDHLIGLMTPTSGRILVADHNDAAETEAAGPPLRDIAQLSDDQLDLIRLHWAVVFQRNALFTGTVRDNLTLWLKEHTFLSESEIDTRIREALRSVALDEPDVLGKDRDALSGGMAKRVAIARALVCDPLVMFYDEPTTGLDPMVSGTIHELIWNTHNLPPGDGFTFRDLADSPRTAPPSRHAGRRTSVIVTHDRDLLRRLAPRVIMLHDAGVCFDGSYDDFGKEDCPPAQAYLTQMPVLHGRPPYVTY